MSRILPPDVSETTFDAALEKFREVLGAEHVLATAEELKAFQDPYPTTSEPEFLPGGSGLSRNHRRSPTARRNRQRILHSALPHRHGKESGLRWRRPTTIGGRRRTDRSPDE